MSDSQAAAPDPGAQSRELTPARCGSCDLLQAEPRLLGGDRAHCVRCGEMLQRGRPQSLDRTLALTLSAAILLGVANLLPFLSFEFQGRSSSNFILSGVFQLWRTGFGVVAAVVFFTTVVAPLVYLGGMLYVLVPLWRGQRPPALGPIFRWLIELRPWAMLEVYLLGVCVAVVKLGQLATIVPDPALFAFVALILIWAAAAASLDPRMVWNALPARSRPSGVSLRGPELANSLRCQSCALLVQDTSPAAPAGLGCPRCGARLERRKPGSLSRTWALLIAAAILYLPANLYPVLDVQILGQSEADTIYSGVVSLVGAGMWEIGALVFFASIVVPLAKLLGLGFLLASVQLRSSWNPRARTRFYRVIASVGRWSFIDTFMISILVALVQLGSLATIDAGFGATCFAAVIVLTMFAAGSFDPRLVWDAREGEA